MISQFTEHTVETHHFLVLSILQQLPLGGRQHSETGLHFLQLPALASLGSVSYSEVRGQKDVTTHDRFCNPGHWIGNETTHMGLKCLNLRAIA